MNNRQRHIPTGQPGWFPRFLCACLPVCVLPIASCQREAFCLFQYISMNLSLDGIHRDETQSSFLNGSRTVHIMSLWGINVPRCESPISWRCSQITVPSARRSPRQLVLSDRSLYSEESLSLSQNKDPRYPAEATGGWEDALTSWEHHLIYFLVKVSLSFSPVMSSYSSERKYDCNIFSLHASPPLSVLLTLIVLGWWEKSQWWVFQNFSKSNWN